MTQPKDVVVSRSGGGDARKRVRGKKTSLKKFGTKKNPVNASASRKAMRKTALSGADIRIDLASDRVVAVAERSFRFGSVTVRNAEPEVEILALNIKAGRDALDRAKSAFVRHGVTLQFGAGIPQFRVDAERPDVLIRELDGKVDRGSIVNGAFIPVE